MRILGAIIIVFTVSFAFAFESEKRDIKTLKKEAVENLLNRKQGFEQYLRDQQRREKQRVSEAYKQKEIRRKLAQKKDRARRSFVRPRENFPYKDWRKFLKAREVRRAEIEKARKDYSQMQDELEKIYKNKKYRINGNREFKL